jgi:hypothetical protein
VAGVILLVAILGCCNSYYPQFFQVTRLATDRDELSIFSNLEVSNMQNHVYVRFLLNAVFSITRENFLDSLKVTQTQGMVRAIFMRRNWMDLNIHGNEVSFYFVSPFIGVSDLTIAYLETLLVSKTLMSDGIKSHFRGTTIFAEREMTFFFQNVCVSEGNLITFFSMHAEFAGNELRLPNGRVLPHHPLQDTEMHTWLQDNKGKCSPDLDSTSLFVEPSGNASNPLDIIRGLIVPVIKWRRAKPETRMNVLLNVISSRYVNYLRLLDNIHLIQPNPCQCYRELSIQKDASGSIEEFRSLFDEKTPEDLVGFLIEDMNSNDDEEAEIAKALCPQCKALRIDRRMPVNEKISEVQRVRGLVCPSLNWLGHAAVLAPNSFVVLRNEMLDDWVDPFLDSFGLRLRHLELDAGGYYVARD